MLTEHNPLEVLRKITEWKKGKNVFQTKILGLEFLS